MALTLIIGGARSGKSELAARLAETSGRDVLVLATMIPGDDEMRARVAGHRTARPAHWRTVEEPLLLIEALGAEAPPEGFVLLDCVTLWVSNLLMDVTSPSAGISPEVAQTTLRKIATQAGELAAWAAAYDGDLAAVTNEVGMGVVPAYALGRLFRDALGAANRVLATRAEHVHYVVAGLALELKALGATPLASLRGPARE